ncbi:transcriptional regulator [Methylorubrum thiocyanatum]
MARQSDAEFCGPACRKAWNNRRLLRGAELYDLFMALRWDRRAATGLHVFTALSRLAAGFRREDTEERAGRRSWASPARIIARRPYLRAERLKQGAGS